MTRKLSHPAGKRVRTKNPAPAIVAAAAPVQYTVRNIPAKADAALRRRAEELQLSLNEVLRRAILREAGSGELEGRVYHDLDGFIGTWQEDPKFDAAIAEHDRVDEEMWK